MKVMAHLGTDTIYRVRTLILISLLLILAACAEAVPTLTPIATLTGPTLEPSPTVILRAVRDEPEVSVYEGLNNPTAAALAPGAAMPPLVVTGGPLSGARQAIEVTATDGTMLLGDFYANTTVLAPGLLLLAPERSSWGDFPQRLYDAGYTVLVMDMRTAAAPDDFQVMLQTLINGGADPARVGVIGAWAGADMALVGCAKDLICDVIGLLSPSNDPALVAAMPEINPRSLFLTASQEDVESFETLTAIQAAATGEVLLQPFQQAGSGTAILQNRPDLGDLIIAWLKMVLV
jgi:hypothetical protein